MIDQLRHQHPVTKLCDLLNVAKSGYQAWSTGKVVPPRKLEDMRLLVVIRAAHQRGRGTYGPKKIRDELVDQGIVVGLNRIKRLRTLHGIRCTHKKKFRVTTDSKHNLPVAENSLNRQFVRTAPNQVWVADITYLPTQGKYVYLSLVTDAYSRKIVGHHGHASLQTEDVAQALKMALKTRRDRGRLVHHSDRGIQYCSAYLLSGAAYAAWADLFDDGWV